MLPFITNKNDMKYKKELRGKTYNTKVCVLLTPTERSIIEETRKFIGARSMSDLFVILLNRQFETMKSLG